jgi:hypothetical protein
MRFGYTFSIIRYTHDPIAGESLNVGVLIHSYAGGYLDVRIEYRYERLSKTFAHFDGERFKQVLNHFESEIDAQRTVIDAPVLFVRDAGELRTAADIGRQVWIDPGLSFRLSEPMAGVCEDLPSTLDELFERFVTSQYEKGLGDRVSDEQVWSRYRVKMPATITGHLHPKTFDAPDLTVHFEHAFKNERWHILQPLSMDYVQATRIQERAARWLGVSLNLQESDEAAKGKYYFLLHPPELSKHHDAYMKAKNILHKMHLDHELVEEDQADYLSAELVSHMP